MSKHPSAYFSPIATSKPAPRAEAQKLLQEIEAAVERVRDIGNQEVDAVVKGDFDRLNLLRDLMTMARQRKTALLDQFEEHRRVHGC